MVLSKYMAVEDMLLKGVHPDTINEVYYSDRGTDMDWRKDLMDHAASAMWPVNKSDGGPSSYYDFDPGWSTFNDFMEDKSLNQWGPYSLHLKDTGKALCRFGAKDGTTKAYDARKIIYSGLRLLGMIEGKDAMRKELEKLLADKQFT